MKEILQGNGRSERVRGVRNVGVRRALRQMHKINVKAEKM